MIRQSAHRAPARWVLGTTSVVAAATLAVLVQGAGPVAAQPTASGAATVAVDEGAAYVALGDSYAAGVGAGSYDPASGACLRSTVAYPALWAAAGDVTSAVSVACGGAKIADMLADQLSALGPDTELVTVTVGGNDAGFSRVLGTCSVADDAACVAEVKDGMRFAVTELSDRLGEAFTAIRRAAPRARVYVLGYPRLFETARTCSTTPLTLTERAVVNAGTDVLDGVIAYRAWRSGFRFVDVRWAFLGHGVCGRDPWITGAVQPDYESYHPNALGQRLGYLPALRRAAG